LTGIIDAGRIAAWSMLAVSDAPLQYVASSIFGHLSLDVAATVKKRLLEGALLIDDLQVRQQGFGALLARLNEASVVEQTSVAEVFGIFAPLAQLAAAFFLLIRGALPHVLVPLFLVFVAGIPVVAASLRQRYKAWYKARLRLTEDLVDKIVGHRTRAVQDNPAQLHDTEDAALDSYAKLSARWDKVYSASAIYGRTWLVVAGFAIVSAFVFGAAIPPLLLTSVATFLAFRAFPALLASAGRLVTWLSAWDGVRPLFEAGRLRVRAPRSRAQNDGVSLDTVVSSLAFAYGQGLRPVLSNANLRIKSGERILIEGPSGGGKTTFSKLLTGELRPASGTILVDGVDVFSVSESEWRRRIASSPQFHENYLFSNTFGFNVDPNSLRGEISAEAIEVCRELGLGELIAKMPSHTAQLLGETGWQLSHGERSRVFIARSLLQGAKLLIFDESFGALDPDSLARAIECVRRRAPTLLVIAHT
jgi:ATP-binding cassette subfamily B protein